MIMASRIEEYKLITSSPDDVHEPYEPYLRVIDVAYEQRCFSDNAMAVTDLVWAYDYCGIAVFDYGYFGDSSHYKGSGGQGEGGGGGYKVVNKAAPPPMKAAGGAG
jgi:hypothetical protein